MQDLQIAVAVIINQDDQILIAKRSDDKHQGGKWEFPGGKVEAGESSQQALHREIHEELGIHISSEVFLMQIVHEYVDKNIRVILDVYEVRNWQGEATGMEQQPIRWVEKQSLPEYQFPEANAAIIKHILAS